jgi:putative transposase
VKKRFSEEQIVRILSEQREGKLVKDIARNHGISENTFYNWKKKYGDMTSSEMHKLRTFEEENARLKRLVADLSLDNQAQKEIIKKFSDPE